jgi:hypothetical protein
MYNRIASFMIIAGVGLGVGLLWRLEPSRRPARAVSDWESEGGSVPREEGGVAAQTTPAGGEG